MNDVGNIITNWRERNNVSREQFADKVGCSLERLSLIEYGRCAVGSDEAIKMAQVMGFTNESRTRLKDAAIAANMNLCMGMMGLPKRLLGA